LLEEWVLHVIIVLPLFTTYFFKTWVAIVPSFLFFYFFSILSLMDFPPNFSPPDLSPWPPFKEFQISIFV
jgi:hypothetical protein